MSATLKISTKPCPSSRLEVEVEVSGDRCRASYEQTLQTLSRTVALPGFRKGKVPRAVLVQQIGSERIRANALEGLVESVWRDAKSQESIVALGQPELREGFEALLQRFQPGETLTMTLELDVPPQPKLRSTRNLMVVARTVAYEPSRVDDLIEQSRKELATLVPVEDRPAESGDVALVTFEGTFCDSEEAIAGGRSEAMEVELEEGRTIPEFVEGILGLKPGDRTAIQCCFPDDYGQEEVRGRDARFDLTLKELKTRELPALDDSFARTAADKDTMEDLRNDLETRLKQEAEQQTHANREEALLEALVAELEVELPETMVQEETRTLIEQAATQMAHKGMDVNKLFTRDLVRDLIQSSRPEAEKRLKRTLAIQALADSESISVGGEALDARIKEVKRGMQQPFQGTGELDEARLCNVVEEELLKAAVVEWLETNSTITEAEQGEDADGVATAGTVAKPTKKA